MTLLGWLLSLVNLLQGLLENLVVWLIAQRGKCDEHLSEVAKLVLNFA